MLRLRFSSKSEIYVLPFSFLIYLIMCCRSVSTSIVLVTISVSSAYWIIEKSLVYLRGQLGQTVVGIGGPLV